MLNVYAAPKQIAAEKKVGGARVRAGVVAPAISSMATRRGEFRVRPFPDFALAPVEASQRLVPGGGENMGSEPARRPAHRVPSGGKGVHLLPKWYRAMPPSDDTVKQ